MMGKQSGREMSDKTDDKVEVPRWALAFILENAQFQDEGPPGEGWASVKMAGAVKALEEAMEGD